MKKSNKMNGLFKAGFIILIVCIPMFIFALIFAYLLEKVYFSAVFSAGGAFLAFTGIILVMFSKPKKIKPKRAKNKRLKKHLQKDFAVDENSDFTPAETDSSLENIDNDMTINYN